MKQPLSRNSFNRLRGYLGLYLQEGAPLVDACWNESSDIHASLLRDAIEDAGLDGSTGPELRIDALTEGDDGRPCVDPLTEGKGRLLRSLRVRGGPGRFYCAGLPIAWPDDRPIGPQDIDQEPKSHQPHWIECLKRGVVYPIYAEAWVETVDTLDRPELDDPGLFAERGSFRKRVRAQVRVGKPLGQAPGEPRGRSTGRFDRAQTNLLLTVQGAYVADRNVHYRVDLVERLELPEGGGHAASVLWDDAGAAEVAYVTDRAPAHALKVALSNTAPFAKGNFVRFEGSGVAPAVYKVVDRDATSITVQAHDCHGQPAQEGLVAALDPWNDEHASALSFAAHPFHSCVEVAARPDWVEGMRVRIHAAKTKAPDDKPVLYERNKRGRCRPGDATVESYEDRTIVRIVRHNKKRGKGHDEKPGETMTLRLDQPLSFEHDKGERVVPERLIRARRYQGHACALPIDRVDPSFEPTEEHHEGPYELGGSIALPSGLSLRLSVDAREHAPTLVAGDGWSFVARAGGWVEAPVFAPVDGEGRGCVLLAELTLHDDGTFHLVDRRPVPAPQAHHGWLATIADAADEIEAYLDTSAAKQIATLARLGRGLRAQRGLVPALKALAAQGPSEPDDTSAKTRAFAALKRSVEAVADQASPSDAELSRLSSAVARLASALASGGCKEPPPDERRAARRSEGSEPAETPPTSGPEAPNARPSAPDGGVPDGALSTQLVYAPREASSARSIELRSARSASSDAPMPYWLGRTYRRAFTETATNLVRNMSVIGARAVGTNRAALRAELGALLSSRRNAGTKS